MEAIELYLQFKEQSIYGRYLTIEAILPILERHNTNSQLKQVGNSVQQKPIYSYQIGTGATKIYLWSQMHGNESTTTKALLDFINLLNSDSDLSKMLLANFTFLTIPILNPDGAALYTRENANGIDLNRDAQHLSQPESKIVRSIFDEFQPNYCFNLHDQRTIYGVGNSNKSATVSFLAPSYDEERNINHTRQKAINLIATLNDVLQNYIPGQVGRFDDSFNSNCLGDTFQYLGVPTILFEAGHYPNDYDREETRKYIFISLLATFTALCENDIVCNKTNQYLNIPQNKIVFFDFIFRNIKINYDGNEIITNFAIQYKEELLNGEIHFLGCFEIIGNLENYFGHYEYDAQGALYSTDNKSWPEINQIAQFSLNDKAIFVNGIIKI